MQMIRQWTEMRKLALSLHEPSTSAGGRYRLKQLLYRFVIVVVIVIVIIIIVVVNVITIVVIVVIFIVNAVDFSSRVSLWPFLLAAFNTSPSLSLS